MNPVNYKGLRSSGVARASAFFFILCLLISCTGGDDDGRRLGDTIVGTWQRGTNPDDVVIEGADMDPDELAIQRLSFLDDGTYNGMVRKGSFQAYDKNGMLTSTGTYQCDNNNLRLEYIDEYGDNQKLLAQVISFTESMMQLRYVMGAVGVTITVTVRKQL